MNIVLLLTLMFEANANTSQQIQGRFLGNCQSPKWSRNGDQLSFEVNFHDIKKIDLYVNNLNNGSIYQVALQQKASQLDGFGFTLKNQTATIHELTWSPPFIGKYAFSAIGNTGDYDIFLSPNTPLVTGLSADGAPDWSNDGRYILFTSSKTGQGDLYVLDVTNTLAPPLQLSDSPYSSELFASFAPNSKDIVFESHNKNGDSVFVTSVDSKNTRPTPIVENFNGSQTRPSWSPDGSKIAYYGANDSNDGFDLMVVSLGSPPITVAKNVILNHDGPSWLPDSKRLVYVDKDPNSLSPIYISDISSKNFSRTRVPTNTVGNHDTSVVQRNDGSIYLAVSAQGEPTGESREYRKIYIMEISNL